MKKISLFLLLCTLIVSMSQFSFADSKESSNEVTEYLTNIQNIEFVASQIILPRGTTSKAEFVGTFSDTEYNTARTKRVDYTEDHYKIYERAEHSSTWHFSYDQYRWSWKGYVKENGVWVYKASSSGTNRVHFDASDIGNFLMNF